MKVSQPQLRHMIRRVLKEQMYDDGPSLPSLYVSIGPNGTPVITHPEADMDLEIVDYDSADDLLFDIQSDLGPYTGDEMIIDEDGIMGGDKKLTDAFNKLQGNPEEMMY